MKSITVTVGEKEIIVMKGVKIRELIDQKEIIDNQYVAALLNTKVVSLNYSLKSSCKIEFLTPKHPQGHKIFMSSLTFLLFAAFHSVYPDVKLTISHSIGDSFYFYSTNSDINPEMIEDVNKKMEEYVDQNLFIDVEFWDKDEAINYFKEKEDIYNLLFYSSSNSFIIVSLDGYSDISITPISQYTGVLKPFKLVSYKDGFLLYFPPSKTFPIFRPYDEKSKLFNIYIENKQLMSAIGIDSVSKLNDSIVKREAIDVILISETQQLDRIMTIARGIVNQKDVKLVTIAGPSSSGKTTFSKKIMFSLRSLGMKAMAISLDDYFVNREQTPKDENGEYDFECIEALDTDYFNQNMIDLFAGKEVVLPLFDFIAGKRKEDGIHHRLSENEILIIEGIHGLNPKLTYRLDKKYLFKIYISPLTQLNISSSIRIPTTRARLIRRMVRDFRYRGISAVETLARWDLVVRGEEKNIFPYQNNADMFFDSALLYEQSVLRTFAEPLLKSVPIESPYYTEASILLDFILHFIPIPPDYVPNTSILREFIGSSLYIQNF
jgi:uridine kinase